MDSRGYYTIENAEYRTPEADGEIDVVGFTPDGKYAIDVEVKCNDHRKARHKAYDQLNRAQQYFPKFKNKRVFKMYAYYVGGPDYKMEWYTA